MRGQLSAAARAAGTIASLLALAACVGCSGGGSGRQAGSATIASSTAPQSADNQADFTTQGVELYSVVNTPLLVFQRIAGPAGSRILPGLAQSLPAISRDRLTYTFTLRKGLRYSNGAPIRATDFKFAIKRALKLNWGASAFLSGHIAGAMAYDAGSAHNISGIVVHNRTRKIVVKLTAPYGPILDVLALPGTAPLPHSTPVHAQDAIGTVGDGPYKWARIDPGHDYVLVKNPAFNGVPASSEPPGHLDTIDYRVNPDVVANAEAVLSSSADVFDPNDTIDPSTLSVVTSQARGRYETVPTNSTFYFFMAVNQKPFDNLAARQAVIAALGQRTLAKYDPGFLTPDCHLLPFGIPGGSSPSTCPFRGPAQRPNLALARKLMATSGQAGAPVVVWGQNQPPRNRYADYLTKLLNRLGFKATTKMVPSNAYFRTIGDAKTKPQIGFGYWLQNFPNPDDFVQLFTSASILPQNSENYGYVRDPKVDSTEAKLSQLPASKLRRAAPQWAGLDRYMVRQGYYAAYGHEAFPKFYSTRLNFAAGVLSVEYQTDLTSLRLR